MVGKAQGLICLDLDGTLLTPEKQVSEEVRRALHEAQVQGCILAISSGRHPFNVFDLMDGLGLERICVCLSGAATFVDGVQISQIVLDPAAVQSAIAIAEREHAYVSVGGADFNISCGSVSRGPEAKAAAFSRYGRAESYAELRSCAAERADRVLKLAFHAADEEQYQRLRERLDEVEGIRYARSDALWLDVTDPSCTKAAGVRALADHLDVDRAQVAVLGDDENDIEAIAGAGFGIAMGNAIAPVKQAAAIVVADNAHDGAAEGIRAAAKRFCG